MVLLTWAGLALPYQEGSWLVAWSQKQSFRLFPANFFDKPPADKITLFSVLSEHLHKSFVCVPEAAAHFSTSRVSARAT